jgi:hypothetical protein
MASYPLFDHGFIATVRFSPVQPTVSDENVINSEATR